MIQFGTDGIRGIYNESLTDDIAYRLGQSLKHVLKSNRLVVGMDTRESSINLLEQVIKGARDAGIDVMNAGVVSTPLISHYSKLKQVDGVMVTASHNPYEYNGLKVFNKGEKCSKNQETAIETFINEGMTSKASTQGELYSGEAVLDAYIDLIETMELYETTLKVGIDTANGANYLIARGIFQELTEHLEQIGDDPTGKNINSGLGSTHIEAIQSLVKDRGLDIGFSFDGDGDRVLAIDESGHLYDGDKLIYIIAIYLKSLGLLKHNTVVLTKMSNVGVIKALEQEGIEVVLTDVGDKYVLREMKKNDFLLGGENSGHIILRSFLDTGDGLLIALYVLKIVTDQQTTLSALTKKLSMWPQVMENIPVTDPSILNKLAVKKAIDSVKKIVGNEGKVLVRPSGTEPVVRVTISCKTQIEIERHMHTIVEQIKEAQS